MTGTRDASVLETVTQRLILELSKHLLPALDHLSKERPIHENRTLRFDGILVITDGSAERTLPVVSVNLSHIGHVEVQPPPVRPTSLEDAGSSCNDGPTTHNLRQRPQSRTTSMDRPDEDKPHQRKRKAIGGLRIGNGVGASLNPTSSTVRRLESDSRVFPQRKKRATDNHVMQPSTLAKYINGVWESLFSGIKLDPAEVIDQWQSVQSNGQPQLLTDADREVAYREVTAVQGLFGRMNILTRKISQTSRTCRSLEVIVQAFWVQCFDDRVQELTILSPREKAKKAAISEACIDFNWSEKELRNKMAIWRGYHDIRKSGGWAALVFAGMGLYRFCKYRVSFTDDTFQALQTLKPRFEVAADTLHPKWRQLLSIVGITGERKYHGHPHDWVVCGPGNEPIPLARTYLQWDKNFEYAHLEESTIDEDAWGLYDPRMVFPLTSDNTATCQVCGECQSDDPKHNCCHCFSSLYGGASASSLPVQVYWTQNGKNNGLLACLAIERGGAVGEFVGQITSGVRNKDVMVGETDKATYQIWQGRQGNHTRFVNHSCQPNSQFERFVWLGTQRIVLVSKGIEAGEEITVDYSDTYWKDLDKECLCGQAKCRYRRRNQLPTPPETS